MSWHEHPTALVAGREITQGLRTRSMRITLAITAVALIAMMVLFHISGGSGRDTIDIGRVRGAGALSDRTLVAIGDAVGVDIDVTEASDVDEARALVDDGTVDVAIVADGRQLLTDEPVDPASTSSLANVTRAVSGQLALDRALADQGLTADEIAQVQAASGPDLVSIHAADDEGSGRNTSAGVSNVALFLMIQIYGGWILNAVTSEKSTRVAEVVLSVAEPINLLAGKLLGVGVIALIHALVLATVAVVTAQILGQDIADALPTSGLVASLVWFVAGYGLYSAAFAAAGSLVSRPDDAQGVAFPITVPLLVGYIATFSVFGGANTFLWVLGFFPPTAVLAMPALYASGAANLPLMLLSLAITIIAVYLVVRLAAKIYERSILHTGRPIRWREALRRGDRPVPAPTTP